jgi:cholesterol 25-hydroxylase
MTSIADGKDGSSIVHTQQSNTLPYQHNQHIYDAKMIQTDLARRKTHTMTAKPNGRSNTKLADPRNSYSSTTPMTLQAVRAILISLFASAIFLPSLWQPLITCLYSFFYNWSLYNYSFFETLETLFVYGFIEPIYTAVYAHHHANRIDIRGPEAKRYRNNASQPPDADANAKPSPPPLPKMARPKHRLRELLTFISPLLVLDLTMVKKYAGVSVAAIRESAGFDTDPNLAISGYFLKPTLHNFSLSSPLQLYRALPAEVPSSRRIVLELAVSLIIYDALFFAIHLAFHRVPALARIHVPHHKHAEMHPQVTNRLSVGERLSLILLANFALNIIGSHVFTRTLFVPLFVYLLIEVHSGVDLAWQYDKILPQGWGAGSRKHAAHHKEGHKYFAPFFTWWDEALEYWDAIWAEKTA